MNECKQHPHGLMRAIDSGRYAGYETSYERVPCLCERTAHGQNEKGVLPRRVAYDIRSNPFYWDEETQKWTPLNT